MARARHVVRVAAAISLAAFFVCPASAQSVMEQFNKGLKPSMDIAPLGPDLFGEQVSLLDGSTSFAVNDVVIKTNGLPVILGRNLDIGAQGKDQQGRNTYRRNAAFGEMWDLDVPYLKIVSDARLGWVGWDGSQNRCTKGPIQPSIQGVPPFSSVTYQPEDWHSGVIANIPGYGKEQLFYAHPGATMPTDGNTYKQSSRSHWRARCIPSPIKRGTGEGFVILLPDGSSYKFDWLVDRNTLSILDSTCPVSAAVVFPSPQAAEMVWGQTCTYTVAVPRQEYFLYATEATDRFGNTITYTYDPTKPLQLSQVKSSDGVVVDLTYSAAGQVQTISTSGRTWTYVYEPWGSSARLKNVILPDQSKWTYEYESDMGLMLNYNPKSTWANCGLQIGTRASSIAPGTGDASWLRMEHPSGAKGEFKFRRLMHGTKQTEGICTLVPMFGMSGSGNTYTDLGGPPSAYQVASLYQKIISGPGLTTQTWDYAYAPGWTAPYTSLTTVTETSGTVNKYRFGGDRLSNYGQLLQRTTGTSTQVLRTENYTYAGSPAGQNYPSTPGSDYTTVQFGWAGGFQMEYRPLVRTEIVQDGRKFISEVNTGCPNSTVYCFDGFVRPTSETKRSEP